jgi:glycosyltransferase involved in cell wall biosynthesis
MGNAIHNQKSGHQRVPKYIQKWMGYIDQYIIFPLEVKLKLRKSSRDSLFVFADQALGPWVPLVKNKKHVVHCHDFLALKSSLGIIPENPTSFSGKQYQKYIRNGFSKGKYFISISKKTQQDLHELHKGEIASSVVCYNGLNRPFQALSAIESRNLLEVELNISLSEGYILHIGGNQYYKNRKGVIEIYDYWRHKNQKKIPLVLIGSDPSNELVELQQKSPYKDDIHFITNLSDVYINNAYSGALCLLFPSLDEGFGWPIAEAMASGCLVITTNEAPMTEVGGNAVFYISRKPNTDKLAIEYWKESSSEVLNTLISLNSIKRRQAINKSIIQAKIFDTNTDLNAIEQCYYKILAQ